MEARFDGCFRELRWPCPVDEVHRPAADTDGGAEARPVSPESSVISVASRAGQLSTLRCLAPTRTSWAEETLKGPEFGWRRPRFLPAVHLSNA